MSEGEIKAAVDTLADLVRVLADADPNDRSEIFRQPGLKLTYHPGREIIQIVGFSRVSEEGLYEIAHGCSSLLIDEFPLAACGDMW